MMLSRTHILAATIVLACAAPRVFAQPVPLPPVPPSDTPVVFPVDPLPTPFGLPSLAQPTPPPAAPQPTKAPPADQAQRPPTPRAAPAMTPPSGQPPPMPAPARPVDPTPGQFLNVKIELTISEEGGTTPASKKVISMTVADRESGMVRSTVSMPPMPGTPMAIGGSEVPLNVDARPVIHSDGKSIRVNMTINYDSTAMPQRDGGVSPMKMQIREQFVVFLENGKPLVVTQSADPLGDRKVTVEVKATILR